MVLPAPSLQLEEECGVPPSSAYTIALCEFDETFRFRGQLLLDGISDIEGRAQKVLVLCRRYTAGGDVGGT